MEEQDKIRVLTDMIVEDFKSTANDATGKRRSTDDPFALHMDPTPLITMLVSPIVTQIVEMIGKKIKERALKTPPQLTVQELKEIRNMVVNYAGISESSPDGIMTSAEAAWMADSVVHVLRKNPGILLG